MFTSEHDLKKHLLWNIAGTVFLALFGAFYESFSHEVYSYYMIYAFTIPLILSVLPFTILLFGKRYPCKAALNLWNAGTVALSTGSVFKGVLDIYGTTNSLCTVYPIVGFLLLCAGITVWLVRSNQKENHSEKG